VGSIFISEIGGQTTRFPLPFFRQKKC
jgi:hypothetical protein